MAVVSTHFSHRVGSANAPSAYHLCDAVSDLPAGTEGDIAYTKDVDLLFVKTSSAWVAQEQVAETSWTPSIKFGGGSTGITYATQQGYYSKGFRRVNITARITLTNKGSSVGAATIEGLPFTTNNTYYGMINCPYYTGFNAAVVGPVAYTNVGSTNLVLGYPGAGAITAMTNTHFNNNSDIIVVGFYFTN